MPQHQRIVENTLLPHEKSQHTNLAPIQHRYALWPRLVQHPEHLHVAEQLSGSYVDLQFQIITPGADQLIETCGKLFLAKHFHLQKAAGRECSSAAQPGRLNDVIELPNH